MLRPSANNNQNKIAHAQHILRTVSGTSIRCYSIEPSTRYISRTEESNIKGRARSSNRVISFPSYAPSYASLYRSVRSIEIAGVDSPVELNFAIEFLFLGFEKTTILFNTKWHVLSIDQQFFQLPEKSEVFAVISDTVAKVDMVGKGKQ